MGPLPCHLHLTGFSSFAPGLSALGAWQYVGRNAPGALLATLFHLVASFTPTPSRSICISILVSLVCHAHFPSFGAVGPLSSGKLALDRRSLRARFGGGGTRGLILALDHRP